MAITARLLSIDEQIRLNQFSQGLHDLPDMIDWFQQYDETNKKAILLGLLDMVIQAHPTPEEILEGATSIKKERTPCAVMLMNPRKPYHRFGGRICLLPETEHINSFSTLLVVLSIADNRRKRQETSCSHWWHQDLSNESFLQMLRKSRNQC